MGSPNQLKGKVQGPGLCPELQKVFLEVTSSEEMSMARAHILRAGRAGAPVVVGWSLSGGGQMKSQAELV